MVNFTLCKLRAIFFLIVLLEGIMMVAAKPVRHRTRTTVKTTTAAATTSASKTSVSASMTSTSSAASTTATLNPNAVDCQLVVPADPLSAAGLASSYILLPPCSMTVATQQQFVEGVIFDPATNQISIFNPLVVDQGKQPAVKPVAPKISANAVIGIFFGSNANTLTLVDSNGSLNAGKCVNGFDGTIFGQVAYCNTIAFFAEVNAAHAAGKLTIPPAGTGNDGKPCPTTRGFDIIDMDQSDNVVTTYLLTTTGLTAQDTAANRAANPTATTLANGSDNALLADFVDASLGCKAYMAPDLADNNTPRGAQALNELSAAANQKAPIALIPENDPMVLLNGNPSLGKVNAYRTSVNQMAAASLNGASGTTYCQNYLNIAPASIMNRQTFYQNTASPAPGMASNLFTFLGQRFAMSYVGLNCQTLLGVPSPISVTLDGNGIAISVQFTNVTSSSTAAAATTSSSSSSSVKAGKTTSASTGKAATTSAAGTSSAASSSASAAATTTKKHRPHFKRKSH